MSTIVRPPAHPIVPTILHRVHAHGAPKGASMIHESEGADEAHAAALAQSKAHPLQRFEVRGVPASVPNAKAGLGKGAVAAFVPNEGGRYESVIAVYQGGTEIPIT